MNRLFTILLFTILLNPTAMAQADFSQDEVFEDIDTPDSLVVIAKDTLFCKDQKIMGSIVAFLKSGDMRQAKELYTKNTCYPMPSLTTVWILQEDTVNGLVQFRILPPFIVKRARNMDNWWTHKKATTPYKKFLNLIQEELLKLQKGLDKMKNQVETREA